ncbi:organic anion transporter 3-like isoform X2 [Eublepharis macularius]|uniref:Organic anion transporter 3-like isoform X2 n=1 Tax=Eublepharis macularius TaxID=481883 RepID=A0AA97KDH8_EUBMA|nr:organic anion transporter 3-like isoform X2 [Eublepharis macularius]
MMTPAGGKSRRPSLAPGIPTTPTISFGDLLEEVGSMGPFQIFSVLLLSLPVLLLASHNLVQNFSAASPEHKCRLSPFNNASDGHPMPLDHSQLPDRCRRFVHQMARDSNSSLDKDRGAETEPCHDGWLYDNSTFSSTLVTEWDLVCNLQPLKNLAQSLFMAGVLVGAFIFGDLSDRFGRRLILIWSLLLVAVMGSGAALSAGFATYCVFRFLSGVGISGFLLNYICLSLEWVPTRYRATVIATQSYCSTAGQVLLAGLAYGIRNWRWLQLAISAPFFCFFAYSWWLPESARWLLANNKHEAALRNLKHVARINGKAATGETVFLEVSGAPSDLCLLHGSASTIGLADAGDSGGKQHPRERRPLLPGPLSNACTETYQLLPHVHQLLHEHDIFWPLHGPLSVWPECLLDAAVLWGSRSAGQDGVCPDAEFLWPSHHPSCLPCPRWGFPVAHTPCAS